MRKSLVFPACNVLLLIPALAFAATAGGLPEESNRYEDCIAATEQDPEQAFEDALAWRDLGGGGPAEHCVAMALLALGYAEEAAVRLDSLARKPESGTQEQRSELLLQAGDAWLLARRGRVAEETFSAALMLTPREAQVWTARARARAMLEEWEPALDDLNAAITFDGNSPEIYTLRSAVHKALGRETLARQDIETALRFDPNFPDALAERGMMRFNEGDESGAREDWIKVLNAAPESAAADVARLGIERMEMHIEP